MATLRPERKQDMGGNALKNFNVKKTPKRQPSQADLIRKLPKGQTENMDTI